MKKKFKMSKNLIKNSIGLLIIIGFTGSFIWALNARFPDKFRNLPEGEIINISLYESTGKNWIPTGTPNRRAKGSEETFLYDDDPTAIFFAHQPKWEDHAGTTYFHRKNDVLPKPYAKTATIVLTPYGKEEIIVKDKLGEELKNFIRNVVENPENIVSIDKWDKAISWVDIYHKDYPAYNVFAELGIISGRVILRPHTDSFSWVYYELPDSLSEQIKTLLNYEDKNSNKQ